MLEDMLLPSAAGRILDIGPARVKQLLDAGRLSAVRTPYGRLIDPTSVERLRREREAAKAAKAAPEVGAPAA